MRQPNHLALNYGQGTGTLNHSLHAFALHFPHGTSIDSIAQELYSSLKNFDHFDGGFNDVAIKFTREIDGVKYVFFDGQGVFGLLSDLVNPKLVPVRVWSDSADGMTFADTAGRHMLVGQRRWQCQPQQSAAVRIVTESFDQPRGWFNRVGMSLMGATRQLHVWKTYFQNIKAYYEVRASGPAARFASSVHGYHSVVPGRPNPWSPARPYPGTEASVGGNPPLGYTDE